MFKAKLRTKFLLSLVMRHRVRLRVRDEIFEGLRNSVVTFQSLQRQRERMLDRSAVLLANLPSHKAVMTTEHEVTIQDASTDFWRWGTRSTIAWLKTSAESPRARPPSCTERRS